MSRLKKAVLQAAVFLACFLLACTVLAQIVYAKLLPAVETVPPIRSTITVECRSTARLIRTTSYAHQYAPAQSTVQQVFVQVGDAVRQGDPLLQIDILEWEARLRALEADIQTRKNNINANEWTGGDRLVLDLALRSAELEYQRLAAAGLPADGILRAGSDGIVSRLSAEPGSVLAGYQEYIELELAAGDEAAPMLEWILSEQTGLEYAEVTTACLLVARTGDALPAREELPLTISGRRSLEDGRWAIQAFLPEDAALDARDQLTVTMQLRAGSYDHVVPRSCIQADASGASFVYLLAERDGLFSQEYTVTQRFVTVVDEDGLHAAILPRTAGESLAGCRIVYSTTKPLRDGTQVRLLEVE